MPSARRDRGPATGLASEALAGLADARPWMRVVAAVVVALGGLERRACSGERRDDHGIGEACSMTRWICVFSG